ncbi:MAG: DUF885 family protein, partial [Candidatus Eremiobacteraeota bacterium]|nr:DUF885 family protein [Candidatus Eremiobacteraeota bacterium]
MKRLLLVSLMLTLAGAAAPKADDTLYAQARSYYTQAWQMSPIVATNIGVHDYDTQLGSYSAAAYAARIASAENALKSLHSLTRSALSKEAAYDDEIYESSLKATLLSLQTEQNWRHNPSLYTQLASNALFTLIKRDFAPLEVRMKDAIAREQAIPQLLKDGAANITTVDATTAQIEDADIKGSVVFFSTVVPQAFSSAENSDLQGQLKTSNDAVIAAIKDFQTAMENGPFAHPSGTFAIGAKDFAARLALQELTPISLADYERAGVAALAQTKAQFIAT